MEACRIKDDINLIYNYLPINFAEIASLLTYNQLKELLNRYGGDNIYIPMPTCLDRYDRDKSIVEDYRKGLSILAISRKYKVSANLVRNIVNS